MNRYLHLVNPWWKGKTFKTGIIRPKYLTDLENLFDQRLIQILTGLRRVGKSTIELQLIKSVIKNKNIDPKNILLFSMEEPSLSSVPIIEIINEFRAEHEIKSNSKIYVFIDEIQFRNNWQQEVKSLYDTENIKFVLIGSSAILLSDKLSYLTGRYLKTQVFPLTFMEYLNFKKISTSLVDNFLTKKYLEEFLQDGGLPEYVLNKTDRYLETTVESILFKDLVSKFQLRNPKILSDMLYLLSDRVGTVSSSLKLSNILEINKDTILTYINYLHKTFITSELNNYSTSRNKEIYNPAKIYFDDTGICSKYSSKINTGALVENAVFNHLKINTVNRLRIKLGYWYENKSEIDFVLSQGRETCLIESKWISKIDEVNLLPLQKASQLLKSKKTLLITKDLKRKIKTDWGEIEAIPLYEFLLNDFSKSLF